MGILNMTPDSFFDGGKYLDKSIISIVSRFKKCDIVDIGFESSRPGASPLSTNDEMSRFKLFLPYIDNFNDKILSIDTYKPEIADCALSNGFSMVNDISGGTNNQMLDVVSKHGGPIVLMHMRGNPSNMQKNTNYKNLFEEISSFLLKQADKAKEHGILKKNIILDPGIGFGKTAEDNYNIINDLKMYKNLGYKILIGHSRKSFLQINNDRPEDRLISSIAISSQLLIHEVDILRVHDIDETYIARDILGRLDS